MKSVLQEIPVLKLKLDIENPRLYTHKIVGNEDLSSDSQLQEAIIAEANGEPFNQLYKAIKKSGVQDPIWVKRDSDGMYVVIEGNRRTTVLRTLLEEEADSPDGISWNNVIAHVIDDSVSDLEIKLQKVRLQSGKKAWGAANDAAVVHELHFQDKMWIDDISEEMQISTTKVKKLLRTFRLYLDYVKDTGDKNDKRYSMFNEVPVKVLDWIEENPRNKSDYHEWVCPLNGPAKIRSATAGRGSAREFAKCLDSPEAMDYLRETPRSTIAEAFDIVKDGNVLREMTFLNRILPMSRSLIEMDESQIAKVANEEKLILHLQSLRNACDEVLNDIENLRQM